MEFKRLRETSIKDNFKCRIGITACIKNVHVQSMKSGGDSLVFTMFDGEHQREVRSFSASEALLNKIEGHEDKVFDIIVDVKAYDKSDDGMSCILFDICQNSSGLKVTDFVAVVDGLDNILQSITAMVGELSPIYKSIASEVLNKWWSKFYWYPAGRSQHHAIIGGLAMHTLHVANTCKLLANQYNQIHGQGLINMDLLVCGALLHDVGKCKEYDSKANGATEYSHNACISTHLMTGIAEIAVAANKLNLECSVEVECLQHLVASHHGNLEWGACIKPNMIEAEILYAADCLDATVYRYNETLKNMEVGEGKTEWTPSGMKCYFKGK